MFRHTVFVAVILLPTAILAQSQFEGRWQTRKGSITLNIAVTEGKASGTIVFLGPHNDRFEMAISSSQVIANTLEFDTKDKLDTWYWRLTLTSKTKGLLHGGVREMLIDERVRKRP
jgi:hypothetical protein